jgi:hypothetical protein
MNVMDGIRNENGFDRGWEIKMAQNPDSDELSLERNRIAREEN